MSGLHGHIFHLYDYDNPELTFGEIKDIFFLISSGQLTTYEKVDGQNIVFSYDTTNDTLLFARNKENIASGGMILEDLQNKWLNLPLVHTTYITAYKTLSYALSKLNKQDLKYIFGETTKIWYSAEIISTINPNVIHYGRNAIVLHKSGYIFDLSNNKINMDTTKNFQKLESFVEHMNNNSDWDIFKPIIMKDVHLKNAKWHLDALNDLMLKYHVCDHDNIQTFTSKAFNKHKLNDHKIDNKNKISNIFADSKYKRLKKKDLQTILNKEEIAKIYPMIQKEEIIKKNLLKPLEMIVHQFAVDILHNTESNLTIDPDQEINRLKQAVRKQMIEIEKIDRNKLTAIVAKLKHVNKINSTIEGITFQHNDKTYKLTGVFAPINQLLGLTRYNI